MLPNVKIQFFLILILTLFSKIPHTVSQYDQEAPPDSQVGFCDSEFYVPKARADCPAGVNFGDRLPKCICIKGVYEVYTKDCLRGVGFATEVCTRTYDEASRENIVAMRMAKLPDWDKVGLIFDRKANGVRPDFDYLAENGRGKLAGERFYTINGVAKISISKKYNKRTHTICIEHKANMKDIICMYRHAANVDLWHLENPDPYSVDVTVRDKCPTGGNAFQNMRPDKCFSPLTLLDSDCQVPCDKSNTLDSDDFTGDPFEGTPDMEKNCTSPQGFFKHENKFIDKQLLAYMVVDQLKNSSVNITIPEPTLPGIIKAYQIYDLIHEIANKSCSYAHLHPEVWDWASKFFMFLHKANKLKYDINIKDKDFNWIMDILGKCSANATTLTLSSNDPNPLCSPNNKKAQGYCSKSNGVDTVPCDFNLVKISPLYRDYTTKNYIIEIVWLFLDIVHMHCFEWFVDSYRMFHVMERIYEKLFTTAIKDYWYYPTWTERVKFNLMTVNADAIVWNAEMCAESIYKYHHNKLFRLVRPAKHHYPMRKRRSADLISSSYDITCAATKSDVKWPEKCKIKGPTAGTPGVENEVNIKGNWPAIKAN